MPGFIVLYFPLMHALHVSSFSALRVSLHLPTAHMTHSLFVSVSFVWYPFGHSRQAALSPPSAYQPLGQSTHGVLLSPCLPHRPRLHPRQEVAPAFAPAQVRHPSARPRLALSRYLPATQFSHSDLPKFAVIFPASQFLQTSDSVTSSYNPIGHAVQEYCSPSSTSYFPASQLMQAEIAVCSSNLLYFPRPQNMQS